MKKALFLAMVVGLMGMFADVAESEIPLPSDISIVVPDPSLPEEFQAISGKWSGVWGRAGFTGRKAMLIIEEINMASAKVIYAFDSYYMRLSGGGSGSLLPGKWFRMECKVSYTGKEIVLEPEPKSDMTLSFSFEKGKPDALEGVWSGSGFKWYTTMKKVK
jgi:hypothetical protein